MLINLRLERSAKQANEQKVVNSNAPPSIGYLVHDLNDAAVHRRVESLARGGADIAVVGFYRRKPVRTVHSSEAHPLAQTFDANFIQRILLVLLFIARRSRVANVTRGANVVIARNLEMLALAVFARRTGQRLIFECLDIHRFMLRKDILGRSLRMLERKLLDRCDLVLVSSPAYEREYFRGLQGYAGPVRLIENKVLDSAANTAKADTGDQVSAGPPWRIGWFGMIRCRKSLEILTRAADQSNGEIEVIIAGVPSHSEFDDFEGKVESALGVRFLGAYDPKDLASLYGSVHFSWCIDFFEEGLNSSWLLPNRLYESIANGAVPIALEKLETGRWLASERLGLRIERAERISDTLAEITGQKYEALRSAIDRCPRKRVAFVEEDHAALVETLKAPV